MFRALLQALTSWWGLGWAGFITALAGWILTTNNNIWDSARRLAESIGIIIKASVEAYFDLGLSVAEMTLVTILDYGGVPPEQVAPVFDAVDVGNRYFPLAECFALASLVVGFWIAKSFIKWVMAYLSLGGI